MTQEWKKERSTDSKAHVVLRSSQRDNLRTFHDYRKPLFTGFLELSVGQSCGQKCATSNTQATNKQQNSQFNKVIKEMFFSTKERHLFLFILNFVDCIYKLLNVQMSINPFGERHSTGMSYNLFNCSLGNVGFRKHWYTSMSAAVRSLLKSQICHKR